MESKSFDNVEYWNRRYSIQSEPYDWYQDADTTSNLLLKYFEKLQTEKEDLELLITGCGTSQLGPVLYSKGCKNITNIDISPVVIEVQKKRYASVPIDFLQRDASKFSDFPNGYFDVIVDKALTDSLLCGKSGVRKVKAVLKEARRVLKAGGMYVMISHGIPESRTCYIDNKEWTWNHIEMEKPSCESFEDTGVSPYHFAYLMVKHKS